VPAAAAGTAQRRWALVTGASSGIGRELATLCAADGHHVVLVARRAGPLESLAAELAAQYRAEVCVVPLDLRDRGAIDELIRALERRAIVPSVLINNAGVGLYGLHADVALEDELGLIDLNIASVVALTKQLLPGLRALGHGRIMNVASVAAFVPGPYMSVYYATKAFVLSYSEALAYELAGSGVTVTALCPGPTESEFQSRAGVQPSVGRGLIWMAQAAAVARSGYRAMRAGRLIVVPGFANRVMVAMLRILPRRLVTAGVAAISRPRRADD
jgi:short-subunit dehydrogenase